MRPNPVPPMGSISPSQISKVIPPNMHQARRIWSAYGTGWDAAIRRCSTAHPWDISIADEQSIRGVLEPGHLWIDLTVVSFMARVGVNV